MSDLLTLVTAAATTPVTVSECKADLRIETTDEDDLISDYIYAATRLASEIVGRKLINETWKLSLKSVGQTIYLPMHPVSSITEIQYYDTDNVSQTVDVSNYYLYNFDQESRLDAILTFTFPAVYNRRDAVNITFVTGYGAASTDVPDSIKRAIRLIVAHWHQNRIGVVDGPNKNELPFGIQTLLGIERIGWVG